MTPNQAYAEAIAQAPKGNKYGAKKVREDGHNFASQKEHRRYHVLRDMVHYGLIRNLELQKRYKCVVNGITVCTYVADFDYDVIEDGEHHTEDVKGKRTQIYALKKKLMAACHPEIKIIEV